MKLYVIIQIISTFFVSTVLGVDEIGILPVYVKKVLEHTQYETWDGKDFSKGTEP